MGVDAIRRGKQTIQRILDRIGSMVIQALLSLLISGIVMGLSVVSLIYKIFNHMDKRDDD
jgi:fructose-specific phosphotransferase system IIC component